jgi:cytochrome c oxidase subunit 4
MMTERVTPAKLYVAVFLVLLVLTGLTTWVAVVNLWGLYTVGARAIAVAKMLLVVLFFMGVRHSSGLTRTVIVAGFFWLAILIALTLSDELTRNWSPIPSGWSPAISSSENP